MIYKQKMFFIISALIVFGFLSISIISYSVARNAAIENLIQTELPLAQLVITQNSLVGDGQ